MEIAAAGWLAVFFFLLVVACPPAVVAEGSPALVGGEEVPRKFVLGGENLAPWANGLLRFSPAASAPSALAPDAKFPLVLAEKRTRRPDVLDKFRLYRGGWDITNKHYWASVGFTGAAGFLLALLWFISFGLAFGAHHCCRWRMAIKEREAFRSQWICLLLLTVFTCAASTGCILLSVGQDEFLGEGLDTLGFVVNQSDFTVQVLKNVTDFLSLAKIVNVDQIYLPSDVQLKIDKLIVDLNDAASMLSEKTTENSSKIRQVFNDMRSTLIVLAVGMLFLAILGFLLSILGCKNAICIFIVSGWLLVAVAFILCGIFVIIDNAVGDTCTAMDDWVHNPQAETALSNILPCVNEQTTNLTLHQSKEVILQIVNIVNKAISSIANSDHASRDNGYFYNQSGPLMPYLCSPYDTLLHDRQCEPEEVSFVNASMVWQNYICAVSDSGKCISPGRVTAKIYNELVAAVNVSYALDHYTPFLLSLQDCKFVRETFNSITTLYCPRLKLDLRLVNAGLALICAGIMLCLILWIFYANRPQREEVFAKPSEVRIAAGSDIPRQSKDAPI
ncbi:uncharacterized protein [Elaeis guineensis]|uniref:Uncharacterized protein LOC105046836 isoform X1 n=1 Tax=Elaeis guineensis var. tenera TaxID=51953 RepID=A0A6I9RCX2_ELAGV|nr:uncharacterized protein LOC105046836 isoform X1 [Elaeis guineensis]